jgi:hypothetical protein
MCATDTVLQAGCCVRPPATESPRLCILPILDAFCQCFGPACLPVRLSALVSARPASPALRGETTPTATAAANTTTAPVSSSRMLSHCRHAQQTCSAAANQMSFQHITDTAGTATLDACQLVSSLSKSATEHPSSTSALAINISRDHHMGNEFSP